jgi:hypothetical protein
MISSTQDGSLDYAKSHYKQSPSIATGDITDELLSTRIACHWAIILKAISLSFRHDRFTL